jgi:uncharacterized protein (TIGR02452 family)
MYACQNAAPGFYDFHRQHPDPRYSDRVIYAPAVPVFRDDDGALLAQPYLVSFLLATRWSLAAGQRDVRRRTNAGQLGGAAPRTGRAKPRANADSVPPTSGDVQLV